MSWCRPLRNAWINLTTGHEMFTRADRRVLYAIAQKLDCVLAFEQADLATEEELMVSIDELKREVEEQTTVVAGVKAAFDGLNQQIADLLAGAGVDQATIDAVTAAIDANTNVLAPLVAANTEAGDEAHSGGM